MGIHLRYGEPVCNPPQYFNISNERIVEAWGVDNNDTIVLEAWKYFTWVQYDWLEVCCTRGRCMADLHHIMSDEIVYKLFLVGELKK